MITIVSMANYRSFLRDGSGGLSCEALRKSSQFDGQYYLSVITESENKRTSQNWEWSQVQQNNPLTPEFIRGIESLDGGWRRKTKAVYSIEE